jgi:uncharacterized membrane-anchored protein YhcB (DUF1043 family)
MIIGNIAIDWTSLLIGLTIGITFVNLINLISAYSAKKRADVNLKQATDRLKAFEADLEKKKSEILKAMNKEGK